MARIADLVVTTALLAVLAAPAAHAQAVQGATAWNSGSTSLQITTPTANELLIIGMSAWRNLPFSPSATVNGSPATLLASHRSSDRGQVAAFSFRAGDPGTYAIEVSGPTLPYVFLFAVSLQCVRASTIQTAVASASGSASATTSLTTDNAAEYVLCIANHNTGDAASSDIAFSSPQATPTEYAELHQGVGIDAGWAWFNSGSPGVYEVTTTSADDSSNGSIILLVAVEPDPITPPEPPGNVTQSDPRGILPLGVWTTVQITFSADLGDVDQDNRVQFEVQVKTAAQDWDDTAPPTVISGFQPPGTVSAVWNIPATGAYDWRYRVRDNTGLTRPADGSWIEFDPGSPDFRSDQTPPPMPVAIEPADGQDVPLFMKESGPIHFAWQASIDDMSGGVAYDVEVIDNPSSGVMLASAYGVSAIQVCLDLATGQDDKHWRIRAADQAGNQSAWGPWIRFRVVYKDNIDHGAEDASRVCGLAAPAGASAAGLLAAAVAGLALAAAARRRIALGR